VDVGGRRSEWKTVAHLRDSAIKNRLPMLRAHRRNDNTTKIAMIFETSSHAHTSNPTYCKLIYFPYGRSHNRRETLCVIYGKINYSLLFYQTKLVT
jgi:hypothetical protein